MKKYLSLVAAAATGSVLTLGAWTYLGPEGSRVVTLERAPSEPKAQNVQTNLGRYQSSQTLGMDFTLPAEKATPAVVHIKSSYGKPLARADRGQPDRSQQGQDPLGDMFGGDSPFRQFFEFRGPQQQQFGPQQATGSGVIVSKDGYIVTNNHVVEGATEIEVNLSDKRTAKAKVIGVDPSTDLAVIKISETNLQAMAFANSDEVKTGQWAIAVGNPFNLESTVTVGVVSAKSRNINILRERDSLAIESFIQTDAAVNPGNSGGALVNTNGDLIGINTAIASPTGSYAGYAFAVPSNLVNKVVEDLIAHGVVQRGLLGVQIQEVNPQLASDKNLNVNDGVYVNRVNKGSAADDAGVKEGDVIVSLNGRPTMSTSTLQESIAQRRPGDKVSLVVIRGGQNKTLTATLKNRSGNAEIVKPELAATPVAKLGVQFESASDKDLKKAGVKEGVKVKKIDNGLMSQQTDMREGFIITKVDKKPVKSVKDVESALSKADGGVMVEGVYPDYPGVYYYAFGLKE
jgi:Do/DeqQ family serine protease